MFDKIKQMKQARDIQRALEQEVVEEERGGVRVRVNGAMRVLEVSLSDDLPLKEQERLLPECLNAAFLRVQHKAAEAMKGMLGGLS